MKFSTLLNSVRGKLENEWGQDSKEIEEAFRRRQRIQEQRKVDGIRFERPTR